MNASPSTPRKTAAKKTAAKKSEPAAKAPEPMDPGAPETTNPAQSGDYSRSAPVSARNCWAIAVLLEEVTTLYPEAIAVTTDVTSRKVGIEVTFSGWDDAHGDADAGLDRLLTLIKHDFRVAEVTPEPADGQTEPSVKVRMVSNPAVYDSRDSFSLAEGYAEMTRA